MSFRKIDVKDLTVNPFEKIGNEWYLVTAGSSVSDYNTMTASWGSLGIMWGKPVFTCGIRPNRHTFGFAEKSEYLTMSFFSEKYRDMYRFCGSKSGRDCDKAKETGITPFETDGAVVFEQADMIMVCRKLYSQQLEKESFSDSSLLSFYESDPYHMMYISEIVAVYVRE